jgi:fructoselysine-6-P-deglycase FrlB-like protein
LETWCSPSSSPAFAASFTLLQVFFALIAAILLAAVAEILLVLLAIEEHLHHLAAMQSSVVQAAQQPAVVAQLTTITQNTRYTADDMLKTSKLLETLIADLRRCGDASRKSPKHARPCCRTCNSRPRC